MSGTSTAYEEWRAGLRSELTDLIKTAPPQFAAAMERIDRLFDEGVNSDTETVEAIEVLAEPSFLSWQQRLAWFACDLNAGDDEDDDDGDDDDDTHADDGVPCRTTKKTIDQKADIYMCGDAKEWVRLRDYNLLLKELNELKLRQGVTA